MNKHFTKDYDIITDTNNHTAQNGGDKPWYGIIPASDDFAVESITITDRGQLDGTTTPTATEYVEGILVGIPFLCHVTQIKLSAGKCKMIKPN